MIQVIQHNDDNVKVYKHGHLVFDSLHPRHEWHPTMADLSPEERREYLEKLSANYN